MIADSAEPLVEVTRGSLVESVHRGHAAAVDGRGRMVAWLGDPETVTYLRSACKPQQALPLITSGAAERFRLTDREIAVTCASHNGEPVHTEAALSILRKAGLGPEHLKCGAHEPYGDEARGRLRASGESPAAVHNNCSGKHAGMLALAAHIGATPEEYDLPGSPVQQLVVQSISRFTDAPGEKIPTGIDGCGLPTFAVAVRAMALMQARLVAPPRQWGEREREACRRLAASMQAHPEMIEGEGELDTELMRCARGRLVSKVGAEGLYTAGVLACERWPRGLGVAVKVADGDRGGRARPAAAVEALRQLGVLTDDDVASLESVTHSGIKNHRGESVGRVRPAFEMRKGTEG